MNAMVVATDLRRTPASGVFRLSIRTSYFHNHNSSVTANGSYVRPPAGLRLATTAAAAAASAAKHMTWSHP
jgi:hypothetical protein